MRYRFDEYVLDAARFELRRGDALLEIQPKVLEVLLFLVRNAERTVTKDEILDAVWSDVATTEASLTRAVSLARRALGESERDARIIQTVRGRGYRIGVPVLADEARAAAEAPAVAAPPPPRRTRRVLALGLVLAAAVALWTLARRPALDPAEPWVPGDVAPTSIAVLPFDDQSEAGDQRHVADGLATEIAHQLASQTSLRVVSTASSFRFREGRPDPRTLGRALGAGTLVNGAVSRDGDLLRVHVEVTDAATGFSRWSESFERPAHDVFAVQDEIGRAVARSLDRDADSLTAPHRTSLRAYDLYLRGREVAHELTRERLGRAIELYERAVELDPGYAPGYAALAAAYVELWNQIKDREAPEVLATAEAAALRALELDPDDPEALTVYGDAGALQGEWRRAEESYQRAIAAGAGARAYFLYANLLMMRGRLEEARPLVVQALVLDPLAADVHRCAGRFHFYAGEYDAAIRHLRRSLELDPDEPHAPRLLANAYERAARPAEAREVYLRLVPGWLRPFVRLYGRVLGPKAGVRLLIRLGALASGSPCRDDPHGTALAMAYVGDADGMIQCLRAAHARHLWYIRVEPVFDPYRGDPRFQEIVRAAGFGAPAAASW